MYQTDKAIAVTIPYIVYSSFSPEYYCTIYHESMTALPPSCFRDHHELNCFDNQISGPPKTFLTKSEDLGCLVHGQKNKF